MACAPELNDRGATLSLKGDAAGARLHYVSALNVNPDYIPTLTNLAMMAGNENNLPLALALFERLSKIDGSGETLSNYGSILTRLERFDEAEAVLNRAAELIPDNLAVWHNKLLLAHRRGDYLAALDYCAHLEKMGPMSEQLKNDKAHILLALGDLEGALPLYEARWEQLIHLPPWDYYIPEWQGQSLAGKRVLIHGEQGFGDTIMTSRFVLDVKKLGAQIGFAVPPGMVSLFVHQDWGIDVYDIGDLPENTGELFDYHSPLCSTMRWLKVTKDSISPDPFIQAPDLKTPELNAALWNVGICWSSGLRGTEMDWRHRHAPLKFWTSLLSIPGVKFWSLQKGDAENELYESGFDCLVENVMPQMTDWADTAAFISKLDVVVSVDTAIVHLAGAMGKPVIMLSQHSPCWRWWGLKDETGRPWYKDFYVFPQLVRDGWESQIKKVAKQIEACSLIANRIGK